jgi:hypothetical protein
MLKTRKINTIPGDYNKTLAQKAILAKTLFFENLAKHQIVER